MKLRIVRIGKPAFPQISTLVDVYQTRLKPMQAVERVELKAKPEFDQDAELLLTNCLGPPTSRARKILICLDEKGKGWTSKDLAHQLQTWRDDRHVEEVVFLIGGPFGINTDVKSKAQYLWKLSDATFTSDFAWLICWEQCFRAFSILAGSQYHHE